MPNVDRVKYPPLDDPVDVPPDGDASDYVRVVDDCGKEEHKERWLASLVLPDDRFVLDCDPLKQTVTFKGDDGEPEVRQVAECWSRVMGYHRPVASWNIGKRGEHAERKMFTEASSARLLANG